MPASGLSIDDLAQRCTEETQRFNLHQPNDPQFCFELMRRALLLGLPEAFTRVYRIYERQVIRWVYSHSRFDQTGEAADYFADSALTNFYFALRGPRFEQFSSLPQVLTYLKLCVHTAVMQYLRDQKQADSIPLEDIHEPSYTPDPEANIQADELWKRICQVLPDGADQLLARLAFVQQMKPAQIVTSYPADWDNEREVSVALQRIRRRLRKDPILREWAGVESRQCLE